MVLRADAVVLDATDWSEAMDTELAIVDACGASDRLIILLRHDDAVDECPSSAPAAAISSQLATERDIACTLAPC